MQKLTSDSCSATPISYWGDVTSCLSCLVIEIPILGYRYLGFGGFRWYFLPMQYLTSDSCSSTPISYWDDEISRISCLVNEIPILGYLGVLGYLATSNAKSDVGFLLGDPDFLMGRRNFVPIVLSYRDPHLGYRYLGFWGFWVFIYFRCKNLTSYDTQ